MPSEESATLALRTQQILAYETGVARVADPLGGSYFVEALTDATEEKIVEIMTDLEQHGGMVRAIEDGYLQGLIADEAYKLHLDIEAGERTVVGVNKFTSDEPAPEIGTYELDAEGRALQLKRLAKVKAERDPPELVRTSLAALSRAAEGTDNIMHKLIDCANAYCTVGEMVSALKAVWGRVPAAGGVLMTARILVAKPGLDGHDRGAKIVARALRDAGFEVIYTGIRQKIEDIVSIAIQEDVAVVGLSILSGAHVALTTRTVEALAAADAGDIAVIVGGTIPQGDVPKLLSAGAAAVFPHEHAARCPGHRGAKADRHRQPGVSAAPTFSSPRRHTGRAGEPDLDKRGGIVRIGVMVGPEQGDTARKVDRMLKDVEWAENAGLDTVWVPPDPPRTSTH